MLTQVIYDFEQAHQRGERPDIVAYLKDGDAERLALLHELILIEIEYHLKSDTSIIVSNYLSRFPEVHEDVEILHALVAAEIQQLRKGGHVVSLEDYRRRFPLISDQLTDTVTDSRPGEARDVSLTSSAPSIAGYEILEELGRGGMGVVYKAKQVHLNRLVALKMILSGTHAGQEERQRFLNEAEIIAAIRHPGVIEVYDFGTHDELPFFAMEFCEGGSLAGKLTGTPLAPREAAGLVQQVSDAVHAGHDKGIVHRDLKPANVLLGENGQPKVTDFGLAKNVGEGHGLTQTGAVMGTPSYMAPEQAQGKKEIGPSVDVYALGAVLYECLTGRPPFRAATAFETLVQVIGDDPVSPRQLNPAVPADLETVCLTCLQKDPRKRYPTAAALADDLARFLQGKEVAARPITIPERLWRVCRRNPVVSSLTLAVVMVVLTALVGLGTAVIQISAANREANLRANESRQRLIRLFVGNAGRLLEQGDTPSALPWVVEALDVVQGDEQQEGVLRVAFQSALQRCPRVNQLFPHERLVNWAEFSPDGSRLVTAGDDGSAQVWDVVTGKRVGASLKHAMFVKHAAFSPDGRYVVTAGSDRTARVWDAMKGTPITAPLQHNDRVRYAIFRPDGKVVLTASHDNIVRQWDAKTGAPVGSSLTHRLSVAKAIYSPDGTRILSIVSSSNSFDKGVVHLWDAGSGKEISAPLTHSQSVTDATFSPDGKRIVTAGLDGTARQWDAFTGRPLDIPIFRHDGPINVVASSPDGSRILTGSHDKTARLWNSQQGTPVGLPMNHPGRVEYAAFSADGCRLVTVSHGTEVKGEVRVWNAFTSKPVVPTLKHGDVIRCAAFSPDGRKLLTAGGGGLQWKSGECRLWDLGFTGRPTAVCDHREQITSIAVNPDGKHLLVGSGNPAKPDGGEVYFWDLNSREKKRVWKFAHPVHAVAFSPNGKSILAVVNSPTTLSPQGGISTSGEVHLYDMETGKLLAPALKHTHRVGHAAFSPDGRSIVTTCDDFTARIWDSQTGKLLRDPLPHGDRVIHASFSPDSKRIVTTSLDHTAQVWDVRSGAAIGREFRHGYAVRSATFSSDGRLVVTASLDQTARVWNAETGKPLSSPMGSNGWMTSALFDATGNRILTASFQEARIWNFKTATPVSPSLRHDGWVGSAVYSPDGKLVVTAGGDKTIRLWDAESGMPVSVPLEHPSDIGPITFSSDGRWLISAAGTDVLFWNISPDDRPVEDLRKVAHLLAGQKIDSTIGLVPVEEDKVHSAFYSLRSKYPDDFQADGDVLMAWHEQEARAKEKAGQWKAALTHLDALCAGRFRQSQMYQRRAKVYVQLKQWGNAIRDYEQVIALGGDDATVGLEKAQAHLAVNQQEKAVESYTRVLKRRPDQIKARRERAQVYMNLRNWEKAAEDYAILTEWGETGSNDPVLWMNFGWVLGNLGRVDDSLRAYTKATEVHPTYWYSWYFRGVIRASNKQWKDAEADFARAAALDGSSHEAGYHLALVRLGQGNLAGYRQACAELLRRFGKTPDLNIANSVAWICAVGSEAVADMQAVVQLAEVLVATRREEFAYQDTCGAVLYRAGKYLEAIKHLEKALALAKRGDLPTTCLFLAMAHTKLKKPIEAKKWLDRAKTARVRLMFMPRSWSEQLEWILLRKETESLLAQAAVKDKNPPKEETKP